MATLICKRGDTLTIRRNRRSSDDTPTDLIGVGVACDMLRKAVRVPLTVTVTDPTTGAFTLSLTAAETAALDLGLWRSDIQFTASTGEIVSTETFNISFVEAITNGP